MDRNKQSGFSLIDLLIAVVLMGILAGLAIPSMMLFVRRSKTAEATQMIGNMFKNVSTYYSKAHFSRGTSGPSQAACIVGWDGLHPTPQSYKQSFDFSTAPSFRAIGFSAVGELYYGYEINPNTAVGCNIAPNTNIYDLHAHGDLDGDGVQSTFAITAGSNAHNDLYHPGGIYREDELE